MIDLHVIDSGRYRANLARQIERLRHHLITVHVCDPVWGNVAEARRIAYSKGSNPFVTWVDDDDTVLSTAWIPDALATLISDDGVSAVYPRWKASGQSRAETPRAPWGLMKSHHHDFPHAHHFTIMRRVNVERFWADVDRPLIRDQDILLVAAQARYGRLHSHPELAYEWSLRAKSGRLHRETDETSRWGFEHWRQTVLAHRALVA